MSDAPSTTMPVHQAHPAPGNPGAPAAADAQGREAEPVPSKSVNPRLSSSLRADYEALQNDVQQANEMAAEFQRQLAGKSNDFAHLKHIFEKTSRDLASLQAGIVALREERHELANQAMQATAYQMRLGQMKAERDRLTVEVEVLRTSLAGSGEEMARQLRQRDARIAELTVQVVSLKQALADGERSTSFNKPERRPPKTAASERLPEVDDAEMDGINISFQS